MVNVRAVCYSQATMRKLSLPPGVAMSGTECDLRGVRRMETGLEQSSPGWIVLLNGTSSAGKSTLARALHELLPEPYYYRSLDHFRQGYADRYWLADDGTLFRRVMHAYLLSLRALASLGHNVIAEAVITPDRLDMYLSLFTECPVFLVGVRCPLEVAQRREWARTDRFSGPLDLAALNADQVHAHGHYDLEVDTSLCKPGEAARRIIAALASPPRPLAYERLRAERGMVRAEGAGEGTILPASIVHTQQMGA
jgi:chloramphenicol 3-O phosphotransferase